jgi:hypothetical protein
VGFWQFARNLPVHLLPCRHQGISLVPVQLLDRLLNLFLVFQHCARHLSQARLALLGTVHELNANQLD